MTNDKVLFILRVIPTGAKRSERSGATSCAPARMIRKLASARYGTMHTAQPAKQQRRSFRCAFPAGMTEWRG